jgi:cell division protein FtsA
MRASLRAGSVRPDPAADGIGRCSVLTPDEKELGVVLIDVGGGTTDVAIFTEGAIRHTAVIPIAGDQITNDIAMALRTPTAEAEEIKLRYGIAKQVLADPNEGTRGAGARRSRSAHCCRGRHYPR